MASERFTAALNAQIAREFAAAHQYVAIGAHYAAETFPQLADFFYGQAEEEREHAMKMVNYLIDRGAQPDIGQVDAPRQAFADHVEPIALALEQERTVTVRISELFGIARETSDYLERAVHAVVPRGAGRGGGVDGRPARGRRAHAHRPDAPRGVPRAGDAGRPARGLTGPRRSPG